MIRKLPMSWKNWVCRALGLSHTKDHVLVRDTPTWTVHNAVYAPSLYSRFRWWISRLLHGRDE